LLGPIFRRTRALASSKLSVPIFCPVLMRLHSAPDEGIPLLRAEQRMQRALVAQVLGEQLVERSARRIDLGADHHCQLAIVAQQALNPLREGPARRIEITAQCAAQRFVHQFAVLAEALFESAEKAVALLADGSAVDGAPRGFERKDADLQCSEREFLAVAAFAGF
jgi:hypothetical protein